MAGSRRPLVSLGAGRWDPRSWPIGIFGRYPEVTQLLFAQGALTLRDKITEIPDCPFGCLSTTHHHLHRPSSIPSIDSIGMTDGHTLCPLDWPLQHSLLHTWLSGVCVVVARRGCSLPLVILSFQAGFPRCFLTMTTPRLLVWVLCLSSKPWFASPRCVCMLLS